MESTLHDYDEMMQNLIIIIIINKLYAYIQTHYRKLPRNRPCRETEAVFHAWIQRHSPRACIDQYRMPIETFLELNKWLILNTDLRDSRYVSAM
jgi:hypothetical protein